MGITRVGQGGHKNPGAESLLEAPKSPNNVTSTFFNTEHLLPKDLWCKHGAPNFLLVPGAIQRVTPLCVNELKLF